MKKQRQVRDINWAKITSKLVLAHELLRIQVQTKKEPKNTHVYNWQSEPDNASLINEVWRDWRLEFPDALAQNKALRYSKKKPSKKARSKNLSTP